MTLTDEEMEVIRFEWDGVRGTVPLQKFAMKYIPTLLSAIEAEKKRADEAEALVRLLEDDETVAIITTLKARVAEVEGALRMARRLCENINEFGAVTDEEIHDAADNAIGAVLNEKETGNDAE